MKIYVETGKFGAVQHFIRRETRHLLDPVWQIEDRADLE